MRNIKRKLTMFNRISILLAFLFVAKNVYSQAIDDCSRPFYMTGESVIYTDSIVIEGKTIYTDSLLVNVTVTYKDSIIVDDKVIYTDSSMSFGVVYPIIIAENPPFRYATFLNDYCGFLNQMSLIYIGFTKDFHSRTTSGYHIFSMDNKYIKYDFLMPKDGELYAKYNPSQEKDKGTLRFSNRQYYTKLFDWIQKEICEGKIVSIDIDSSKKRKTFIGKSFNPN